MADHADDDKSHSPIDQGIKLLRDQTKSNVEFFTDIRSLNTLFFFFKLFQIISSFTEIIFSSIVSSAQLESSMLLWALLALNQTNLS